MAPSSQELEPPANPARFSVDLREVTMADGRNAYAAYQELAGHLPGQPSLKSLAAKLMASKGYLNAPDGEASAKGTKLHMLTTLMGKYRDGAMRMLKRDPKVREAMMARDLKVRDAYRERASQAVAGGWSRPGGVQEAAGKAELGAAFGVELNGIFEDAPVEEVAQP